VVEANGELVNAINQIADRIIQAIIDKELEINIGDDEIARSANNGNARLERLTGTT